MIYYVLCVLIAIALPPLSSIGWALARRDLRRDYEGPAKLDLFGHQSHIGWVRQTADRIEILTIQGEALQIDARARYKLQALTWQQLCDHAARECEARERGREEARKGRDALERLEAAQACAKDFEERHSRLRIAIEKAADDLQSRDAEANADTIYTVCGELREAFNADDPMPF